MMADQAYGSKFWIVASGDIAVEVVKIFDFVTDVFVLIQLSGKEGENLPAVFPASLTSLILANVVRAGIWFLLGPDNRADIPFVTKWSEEEGRFEEQEGSSNCLRLTLAVSLLCLLVPLQLDGLCSVLWCIWQAHGSPVPFIKDSGPLGLVTLCRVTEIVFEAAPQSFIQSHVLWVKRIVDHEPLESLQLISIVFSVMSIGLGLRNATDAIAERAVVQQDSGSELKEEMLDSLYFVSDAALRVATAVVAIGYMGPLALACWAGSWLLLVLMCWRLFVRDKILACAVGFCTCGFPVVLGWLLPLNKFYSGVFHAEGLNNDFFGPRVSISFGLARVIEMLILASLPMTIAEGPLPAIATLPLLGVWLLVQLLLWRQLPKWYNHKVDGKPNDFRSFLEPLVEGRACRWFSSCTSCCTWPARACFRSFSTCAKSMHRRVAPYDPPVQTKDFAAHRHHHDTGQAEESAAWHEKARELAERGFELQHLLLLYSRLGSDEVMPHFNPLRSTTNDVVRQAIIPLSWPDAREDGVAYVNVVRDGPMMPDRMVSHNWNNYFTFLVAAIVADALDNPTFGRFVDMLSQGQLDVLTAELAAKGSLNIRYWVCALCINQHASICGGFGPGPVQESDPHGYQEWDEKRRDTVTRNIYPLCTCESQKHFNNHKDECELNKFDAMMRAIAEGFPGQARQVIAVDADGEIFERAWVVAELIEAHYMQFFQKVKLKDVQSLQMVRRRWDGQIDVQRCKASRPEDKEEVLAKIRGGNVAGFNKELNALIFGDVSQPGLLRNFEKELAESAQHVAEPVSSTIATAAAAAMMIGKALF